MFKQFAQRAMFLVLVGCTLFAPVYTFGAEEEKPPLMPPISGPGSDQTIMQAIWVLIIFVIMLAILYPTAWKNVLAGLKAREDKIRGDIAAAEGNRAKAEATLKQYNEQLAAAEARVRDMISKAGVDAEAVAASIRTRGQQEAEEAKEKAVKEIEAAKKAALADVYNQTAELATSVAEKILRRNLNANDQRDLVARGIDQIPSDVTNN